MAIRKIHAVPRDLPHAHLYLDDIEEISRILLAAAADDRGKSARILEKDVRSVAQSPVGKAATEVISKTEANVNYTIGDTQMDSVIDLQTYGGSSTNFTIKVGTWGNSSIRFYSWLKPTIELRSMDEGSEWSTYGKIKSIFDRRQLRTKNAIAELPGWLRWASWMLFALVPSIIALMPVRRPVGLYLIVGWLTFLLLTGFVLWRPSRVFFIRSHERSKMSSEIRKTYVRDIIFLAIGALISQLISRLFHK